jgi:hypothetical protein
LLEDINNGAEGVGLELHSPEEDVTHELLAEHDQEDELTKIESIKSAACLNLS